MEDGRVYLLTGAAGFLGNNIVKQLIEKGCRVRGLVLKGDKAVRHIPKGVEIVYGDLTDKTSLEKFDLDKIVGYYGKTKAMATQLVFDAVKEEGLKACVVYPTGICGPNDYAGGPVSTFIEQYCNGGNKVGFPGSFNSVDVRDLAAGTIAAVDKGRIGEGYILGNDVVWMKDMFAHISHASGVKMAKIILPMPLTRIIVKVSEAIGKLTNKDPLITELMLYNLVRNNAYDSSKAKRELGYQTRPFAETIYDEVEWLKEEHRVPA